MKDSLAEKFEPIITAWAQKVCEPYLRDGALDSLLSGYEFRSVLEAFCQETYKQAFEKIKPELSALIMQEVENRKEEIARTATDLAIRSMRLQ